MSGTGGGWNSWKEHRSGRVSVLTQRPSSVRTFVRQIGRRKTTRPPGRLHQKVEVSLSIDPTTLPHSHATASTSGSEFLCRAGETPKKAGDRDRKRLTFPTGASRPQAHKGSSRDSATPLTMLQTPCQCKQRDFDVRFFFRSNKGGQLLGLV